MTNCEWNLHSYRILLAIKENSPSFPIKRGIDIYLIEIIFVGNSILSDSKKISLPYLAIRATSSLNCILNRSISISIPILVIFFATANPLPFLISKVSQRVHSYLARSRQIGFSVRRIMELNIEFVCIIFRNGLFSGQDYVLNRGSSYISNFFQINFLV